MSVAIDPLQIRIQDLDVLEAQRSLALEPVPAAPPDRALPKTTNRDARQRVIGALKVLNWLCGGSMTEQVDSITYLVGRVDQLEDEIKMLKAEKADLRQGLMAISTVLDEYTGDPFENKVANKWPKPELVNRLLAVCQSVTWAVQRAENALDPKSASNNPIARDPEEINATQSAA